MKFAFSQLIQLFDGKPAKVETKSELFWASLHGFVELMRTERFPAARQKERTKSLIELFTVA
jgi:hypothetical protein